MGWHDYLGNFRHEVRTIDGHLRFYSGCSTCVRDRCCLTKEDCHMKCPANYQGDPNA